MAKDPGEEESKPETCLTMHMVRPLLLSYSTLTKNLGHRIKEVDPTSNLQNSGYIWWCGSLERSSGVWDRNTTEVGSWTSSSYMPGRDYAREAGNLRVRRRLQRRS